MPDHEMPAGLGRGRTRAPTPAGEDRAGSGLEHRRQRRGLEDRSVLVGATAHQRRAKRAMSRVVE